MSELHLPEPAGDQRQPDATVGKVKRNAELSTRERTYEHIRRAILLGEFSGGTFIEEEIISERIGVSRTPVREAFHRLNAEQYITLVPRKGALVRQANPLELNGLFEARLMIESYVFERICGEKITIPQGLSAIVEQMQAIGTISTGEGQLDFIMLDWNLHRSIVDLSGNNVLTEMYDSIQARFYQAARTIVIDVARQQAIYKEHKELLEMLNAYDLDGLKIAIRKHLRPAQRP